MSSNSFVGSLTNDVAVVDVAAAGLFVCDVRDAAGDVVSSFAADIACSVDFVGVVESSSGLLTGLLNDVAVVDVAAAVRVVCDVRDAAGDVASKRIAVIARKIDVFCNIALDRALVGSLE